MLLMPSRLPRRSAIWKFWMLAIMSPVLQACYEYAPVDSQAPAPSGRYVEMQITDRGRVGLGQRFGAGVKQINGTVVTQQGNALVLSIDRISNIEGEMNRWAGDTAQIDRDFIGSMTERRISKSRTALLVAAAGATVVVLASSGLLGGGKDREEEPAGPTNQTNRIPMGPRFSRDLQFTLWRIFAR